MIPSIATSSNMIVMSKKHEVKGQGIAAMYIGIQKIGHVHMYQQNWL